MTATHTRWRLAWAAAAIALVASAGAGLLWGAERARPAASKAPAEKATEPGPALPVLPASPGGVEIVTPESGAKIRGVARVRVSWDNLSGYVIYRVDGDFAYATASPYEMRWDTGTASDDEHVITADAYDSNGDYQGTSSIKVTVQNEIPTPPQGMLLTIRFRENDLFKRRFQARSETSALTAEQALPEGFNVLTGVLRCDLTQSVMDTFYEGTSALVRNRVRQGGITIRGVVQPLPEVGQYAMVQVSRNGLALPATAAVTRPRIGLGEISLALPDYPVFPGDQWESPLGAVCDLYTRRVVFVQAQHTFEGLRWFRGRECAVVTSSYSIAKLPLFQTEGTEMASAQASAPPRYTVELAGGGPMGGMMGGGGRGRRRGGGGQGVATRQAARPGQRQTPAAAPGQRARVGGGRLSLESVNLVDLKGTRRTYVTRATGKVLHTEDTVLGKVEFRGALQQASASTASGYGLRLTGGMMGGGRRRGATGRGQRGRRAGAQAQPARQRGQAAQPGRREPGLQAGGQLPPSLDYGLRLTADLVID